MLLFSIETFLPLQFTSPGKGWVSPVAQTKKIKKEYEEKNVWEAGVTPEGVQRIKVARGARQTWECTSG